MTIGSRTSRHPLPQHTDSAPRKVHVREGTGTPTWGTPPFPPWLPCRLPHAHSPPGLPPDIRRLRSYEHLKRRGRSSHPIPSGPWPALFHNTVTFTLWNDASLFGGESLDLAGAARRAKQNHDLRLARQARVGPLRDPRHRRGPHVTPRFPPALAQLGRLSPPGRRGRCPLPHVTHPCRVVHRYLPADLRPGADAHTMSLQGGL